MLAIGAAWLWVIFDQVAVLNTARAQTPDLFAPYQAADYAGPKWQDLPQDFRRIWLRLEDPGFFEHGGADFRSAGAGLTTITQDLTRRMFFNDFSPGYDWVAQVLIAVRVVDALVPKEVQLTAALDLMDFGTKDGRAVIGFAAAAQQYYGVDLSRLSGAQFAGLVAMLPDPDTLQPGSLASDARMERVFRLLDGGCAPLGWRDVWLEGCA